MVAAMAELHYWNILAHAMLNTILVVFLFFFKLCLLWSCVGMVKCKCLVNAFISVWCLIYTHKSTKEISLTKTFINLAGVFSFLKQVKVSKVLFFFFKL